MTQVGELEIQTQKRLLKLFKEQLGYEYLGDWHEREGNSNIEEELLSKWLSEQGHDDSIISKTIHELGKANSIGGAVQLYDANRNIYELLRYGIKVRPGTGENRETVWLIDWKNPGKNHFAVAEEVTILGKPNTKRPDVVIYVNGIALGVIELKRSTRAISHGIRQNLDNQKKEFIEHFFTTIQLVFAGNDTEGLRYGVIQVPERFFLKWKEDSDIENPLDKDISHMCAKERFLEIIHDFIVFDKGIKKMCRQNQYFGVKAAQKRMEDRDGGIIWHTQGSGKSLVMVWLAKWIRENVSDIGRGKPRVLIITDRTELDHQIEKVFKGVNENIYRAQNSQDLIDTLNSKSQWLMCSLVHKFGSSESNDTEAFIEEIKSRLPSDFSAKDEMFVFIDECHRTQSGKMHRAMKEILSDKATIVGFTGTPLMKTEKKTTLETFGSFIHTYKYDEAVADKVILDLRYDARKIEQELTSPSRIDRWFEAKTRGLNDAAKAKLKKRWGTMQKLVSSEPRIKRIVQDIVFDMEIRERLKSGEGNAMLIAENIGQACRYYKLFSETELDGKCAIVTSYVPQTSDLTDEESGEGQTENVLKYGVYTQMLAKWFEEPEEKAIHKAEEFEKEAKKRFVDEPGRMKLLIVVDKLLTGFDAPSATYLYIDKKMRDHGLFQAICRVNRLDDESKEYGYIIDYKDLFNSIESAFGDYTSEAFDSYEKEDVEGLLKNRLQSAKEKVEANLEQIRTLCEMVEKPHETDDYCSFFCDPEVAKEENQEKRSRLYRLTRSLIRSYAEIAHDMKAVGYNSTSERELKKEIGHYEKVYEEIQIFSGDYIDMKMYEPGMRHLIDSYIRADESISISSFDDQPLAQLLVKEGKSAIDKLPEGIRTRPELVAETIRSNVRRLIVEKRAVNPAYYDDMSEILEKLIEKCRNDAKNYEKYLGELAELAKRVEDPHTGSSYPDSIRTRALTSLYDNLDKDEELAIKVNKAILSTKKDNWKNNPFKKKEVRNAIKKIVDDEGLIDSILEIAREQDDY